VPSPQEAHLDVLPSELPGLHDGDLVGAPGAAGDRLPGGGQRSRSHRPGRLAALRGALQRRRLLLPWPLLLLLLLFLPPLLLLFLLRRRPGKGLVP
jgi:hypothetical protein